MPSIHEVEFGNPFLYAKAKELYEQLKGTSNNAPLDFNPPKGIHENFVKESNELFPLSFKKDKMISDVSCQQLTITEGRITSEKFPVWETEAAMQKFVNDANALIAKRNQIMQSLSDKIIPASKKTVSGIKPDLEVFEKQQNEIYSRTLDKTKSVPEGKMMSPGKLATVNQIDAELKKLGDNLTTIYGSNTDSKIAVQKIIQESEGMFTLENGRIKTNITAGTMNNSRFISLLKRLMFWMPKDSLKYSEAVASAGHTAFNAAKKILQTLGVLMVVLYLVEWKSKIYSVELAYPEKSNESPQQRNERLNQVRLTESKINEEYGNKLFELGMGNPLGEFLKNTLGWEY
jgi:hypothetical protein